jgi:ATP-binding cassette subfamily B protein/ATP-binding cassette subfamily C protein
MKIPIKQYWILLSQYLRPQRGRVWLLAVAILAHISLRLLNPQITRRFIDGAMAGEAVTVLLNTAVLFILIALISQGLSIVNTYLGENVAWTATNALRLDLLLHCLQLDQSFHKQHTAGELLERIDGDVNTLSNFFSRFAIYVVGNGLLMVGTLVLLYFEDWRIGAAITGFVVIGLTLMLSLRSLGVPYWEKVRQISAEFYGFLGELLGATEDVRANGAGGFIIHRFDRLTVRWFNARLTANMLGMLIWGSNIVVFGLGNAIAFGLSAYLWRTEALSIGTIYLIFYYTELLRRPMIELRNQIEDLQRAEASISRIKQLLAVQSKLVDGTGAAPPAGALPVEFVDVSFSYDAVESDQYSVFSIQYSVDDGQSPVSNLQSPILQNITLRLEAGRVLGILGRTGSGKTTLARLLLRLYDPAQGEIRVGGIRPSTTSLAALRHRVSLVTQDVQLFQASIRDNLTFFNPTTSDEQITAVLQDLGLGDWLQKQPHGLDTELAPGASSLSAGQAQLLAFARVFLTDPGLVILDEASSRLDPATEQLIERALDKLLHNRTGIIIAHHLATVERADEILILENGRILEHGSRLDLAQNPDSHFYKLLKTGLEEVLV